MSTIRYIALVSLINFFLVFGFLTFARFYLQYQPAVSSPAVTSPSVELVEISTDSSTPPVSSPSSTSPVPTSPPSTAPTTDPRCLITIDGRLYNITEFRSTHPGGNIFTCGTDMSAVFYSQHDSSYLAKLSPYAL